MLDFPTSFSKIDNFIVGLDLFFYPVKYCTDFGFYDRNFMVFHGTVFHFDLVGSFVLFVEYLNYVVEHASFGMGFFFR